MNELCEPDQCCNTCINDPFIRKIHEKDSAIKVGDRIRVKDGLRCEERGKSGTVVELRAKPDEPFKGRVIVKIKMDYDGHVFEGYADSYVGEKLPPNVATDGGLPKGESLEEHMKHCKAKSDSSCPFKRQAAKEDTIAAAGSFPDDDGSGSHAHFEFDPADLKAVADLTSATEKVNQKIEQGDTTPCVEAFQTLASERTNLLRLAKRHEEFKPLVLAFVKAGATGFAEKLDAVPQPAKAHAQMAMA